MCACDFHVETVSANLIWSASEASKKKSVLGIAVTNLLKNIGMVFKI